MFHQAVHEQHAALLQRNRDRLVAANEPIRNGYAGIAVLLEPVAMAVRYQLQAAVFDRGVQERNPEGLTRSSYAQAVRPEIRLIRNSVSVDDLNKDEASEVGLLGDRAAAEAAVAEVAGQVAATRAEWTPVLTDDSEPLSYYRVVHALNEVLDPDTSIVTHDAGAPRNCIVPFYRATVPIDVQTNVESLRSRFS